MLFGVIINCGIGLWSIIYIPNKYFVKDKTRKYQGRVKCMVFRVKHIALWVQFSADDILKYYSYRKTGFDI